MSISNYGWMKFPLQVWCWSLSSLPVMERKSTSTPYVNKGSVFVVWFAACPQYVWILIMKKYMLN